MSRTFRVIVVFDYEIDDDRLDVDTVHDMLRDIYEEGRAEPEEDVDEGFTLESVRDVNVVELED